MADNRNYLLGYGERLTAPVDPILKRVPTKQAPYTFSEARARITPMLNAVAASLAELPASARPQGQGVASVTLHPEYYAKSHYPGGLLRDVGLRTVGSRATQVVPEQRSRGREPELAVTTELFVAGQQGAFALLARHAEDWAEDMPVARQLAGVEAVSPLGSDDRIRGLLEGEDPLPLEIVLHASESFDDRFIVSGFRNYLEELELSADLERVFYAGQLCFMRMMATPAQARQVARFSFLRVVRRMPRLRTTTPILRRVAHRPRVIELPADEPVDPNLRVAVFDGGLSDTSVLTSWANPLDAPDLAAADPSHLTHGEMVTSALLFGSIDRAAERPLCNVDHYRVLDVDSEHDPLELYDVLERIKSVLDQRQYQFVNLSLGPTLPVDDDDVHSWTAVLDEYLSDGRMLASIAAGNTGEEPDDPILPPWRVQVPSDCVNGLTVGASDKTGDDWARALYSSRGPGRSPGIVKPDLVTFGGSDAEAFWVVDANSPGHATETAGTSFAAPSALRAGIAVRAHLGPVVGPLAIKALLVHRTDPAEHPRHEVGWGRLPDSIDSLILCPDGSVRVLYQDTISPASFRRIRIPVPQGQLQGIVSITATFCFATPVDPGHSGNYTKSGLSVFFRPNMTDFSKPDSVHPRTAAFFQAKKLYQTEQQLRGDAHKWETCLHATQRKRADSLNDPVFDIHYNARAEGENDRSAQPIRYALVITINAPKNRDLYDRVVRTYRAQLQPLTPVLEIPVRPDAG